ncbi:MAG: hypothetical protein A2W68_08900 [Betaproteobacteria bacterium RIFCSPLOWO2_02_64_14]|nr:MAG: hypothetical protein A2W68_08900 [Betaproteobacteria bacterium RIFCSPLOWO2_02_64_14]
MLDNRNWKLAGVVTSADADDVWRSVYHENGAHYCNEWEHERKHYRKNWCVLREREAHRAEIKSFCITIDRDPRDYLPHMYGSARWTLVDDVSRLPLKVADIYRRLTA